MTPEAVFFVLFALGAVGGSAGVLLSRQPINSAISLVVSFFFLAGLYVLLSAHFLAVLQILVYAGAIMVLFVFVLMLLNLRSGELGRGKLTVTRLLGVGFAGASCYVLASSMLGSSVAGTRLWGGSVPAQFGTVRPLGLRLMTEYVLPFEMASVLLLVGIVGAVVVAKRRL
ncbi:MAG: NADH-quinone oxidoreductase subunit J [Myxococcales bacterium]|nr:NADH-quinone oxidoreductase subunit J [Myxococcales bacterium]